jgi:hypothetical protein
MTGGSFAKTSRRMAKKSSMEDFCRVKSQPWLLRVAQVFLSWSLQY